jgi:hypothetical protein
MGDKAIQATVLYAASGREYHPKGFKCAWHYAVAGPGDYFALNWVLTSPKNSWGAGGRGASC